MMKEVTNIDILAIEDRELRSLVKYEQIMAWYRSGGFQAASAAYHARIAEAARVQAVAELRIAQINVIEQAVARFDARSVRNAQMAQVAAQHRAFAAERQAIQAACDEIMWLEEIIPADDIDDIPSQVSAALGIKLPSDADRADICRRGHKSMADLKRELGPSLADPVKQMDAAEADVIKAGELIADVRRASILQGMEAAPVGERYFETSLERVKAEGALLDFVKDLAAKAHGLAVEPVLNEETLDLAWKAANDQFDAGKTLEELGWQRPEQPVDAKTSQKTDADQLCRMLDEYKTAVATYVSVNTKPCQVKSEELLRRREAMYDHEHRFRTYVETGQLKPLGDGRTHEHNGIRFVMRMAS